MTPTSVRTVPGDHEAMPSRDLISSDPSTLLVYLGAPESARKLIPYAKALADTLNSSLTLLHVLELPAHGEGPADPVGWGIRRQEVYGKVRQIAVETYPGDPGLDIRIAEGRAVDQICNCARELEAGITVVGMNADENATEWELDDTVRRLINRSCGALLLVPSAAAAVSQVRYKRILIPLDGSRTAESVLPLATRLAKAAGAELVIGHVIPAPELTETGPLEEDDHKLRRQVRERNERVARRYVDETCSRIAGSGVAVRGLVVSNGDVRSKLAALLGDEKIDLLVMSAHGHSGRHDVACGSVADYMITHARSPLLVVMGENAHAGSTARKSKRYGGRLRSPTL